MKAIRNTSDHATWTAIRIVVIILLLGGLLFFVLQREGGSIEVPGGQFRPALPRQ